MCARWWCHATGAASLGEKQTSTVQGIPRITQDALAAFGEINYTLSKLWSLLYDLNRWGLLHRIIPMSSDTVSAPWCTPVLSLFLSPALSSLPLPSQFATLVSGLQLCRDPFIIICRHICLELLSFDPVVYFVLYICSAFHHLQCCFFETIPIVQQGKSSLGNFLASATLAHLQWSSE